MLFYSLLYGSLPACFTLNEHILRLSSYGIKTEKEVPRLELLYILYVEMRPKETWSLRRRKAKVTSKPIHLDYLNVVGQLINTATKEVSWCKTHQKSVIRSNPLAEIHIQIVSNPEGQPLFFHFIQLYCPVEENSASVVKGITLRK